MIINHVFFIIFKMHQQKKTLHGFSFLLINQPLIIITDVVFFIIIDLILCSKNLFFFNFYMCHFSKLAVVSNKISQR